MRPKEQPRRVGFAELLGLVQRAAKLFATLGGGSRPGVAYMLPSLVEAHATLWGAEAIGYAVPINFLLQPDAVAGLLEACGARILVALGPHPALDLAEGPGAARARARAGSAARGPARHAAGRRRAGLPHRRLHRPPPKLVTHTHRSQIASAFGGAALGDMRATDTLAATLPLFHVGGTIFCGLSAFMAGTNLLVMSPGGLRNPAMVQGCWRLAAQYGTTLAGAVPTGLGAIDPVAGRLKDLIIRSAHNIDPLMIENAMAMHPAVGLPDAYAGEVPVCYLALRPGARATEDELHEHAQRTIAERPAWPKQIHLVDAIALTSVGKIHKPQLRCDAAAHLVTRLVREQLALPRAQVQASEGGKRGMVVRVGPAGVLAETRMQHHRGQLVPCTPGVCRCCNAR